MSQFTSDPFFSQPGPSRHHRSEPRRGPRPSKSGRKGKAPEDRRKRGFQVGPAHAPHNAYLGKAKKIKANLIMQSKLKREYAKVLKEEGMESKRLKPRVLVKPHRSKSTSASPSPTSPTSATSPASADSSTSPILSAQLDQPTDSSRGNGGSKGKRPSTTRQSSGLSTHSGKRRALSPADIGPPMPQTSLRELKKEAYRKYHPGGGGGAPRAQPNMGARMGVLLEKIKRDKTAER